MRTWSLAERFDLAHTLAKGGASIEDIVKHTTLSIETARAIHGRSSPGKIDPMNVVGLQKNTREIVE